jgi:ATP-dependent Clp protease adaptor protein ClpS
LSAYNSLFFLAKKKILLLTTKKYFLNFVLMSSAQTDIRTKNWEETDLLTAVEEPFTLIVWNDEVNTFEWVIETLIEVCGHSYEQAEQCAYIIHFQGKYAVKKGSYDELKPMCNAITDRGIGATVEMVVA